MATKKLLEKISMFSQQLLEKLHSIKYKVMENILGFDLFSAMLMLRRTFKLEFSLFLRFGFFQELQTLIGF